jgi:hypothetical protein
VSCFLTTARSDAYKRRRFLRESFFASRRDPESAPSFIEARYSSIAASDSNKAPSGVPASVDAAGEDDEPFFDTPRVASDHSAGGEGGRCLSASRGNSAYRGKLWRNGGLLDAESVDALGMRRLELVGMAERLEGRESESETAAGQTS